MGQLEIYNFLETTSGKQEVFEVITGQFNFRESTTGIPKPS